MTPEALKAVYQDSNSWQQVADAVNHDTPTTTGEWMEKSMEQIWRMVHPKSGIMPLPEFFQSVADAHNAALAAERENVEIAHRGMDHYHDQAEKLREQLAAERKKNDDWRNTERRVAKERDTSRQQLAAAVEAMEYAADPMHDNGRPVLRAALAKIGGKP